MAQTVYTATLSPFAPEPSWMCANGHHGSPIWREPWTHEGTCAYWLRSLDGKDMLCPCECHKS